MKQKRKVRSLLPQRKNWKVKFLTTLLLVLSVVLCIWSVSLISSYAWAIEIPTIDQFNYTWVDEKQEALYGMRFVYKENMVEDVINMYVKGRALYVTPNPVVVNPINHTTNEISDGTNTVNEGLYGHVLWWFKNKVSSDNVTLIAWEENEVPENNDNATLLWWKKNKNFGRMKTNWTPMVVVWWEENEIWNYHDGVALLWWKKNKVGNNVTNAFILWWEENRVDNGVSNVIVWWKNVGKNVGVKVDNVFVYSNKDNFEPQTPNAFYLNVENGVWINTDPGSAMAVKGAVKLWDIDVDIFKCDTDNLWVEWSYNGCVIGCTSESVKTFKWEMLDRSEHCRKDVCATSWCVTTGETVIESPDDYGAFCTEGVVDITYAEKCYPESFAEYNNAVFETSLVDNGACPELEPENKCVYQCKDGYHLAQDEAGGTNVFNCYADCEYEWDDDTKIKYRHNETVIWYNAKTVTCSNNDYVFPLSTILNNKWTPVNNPLYTIVNNKAKNGNSPETCLNYDHKKVLVCNNGTMYLTQGDWKKADTTMNARDNGYIYKDCSTENYTCDDSFDLTKKMITDSFDAGGLDDRGDGRNGKGDREKFGLTRWKYILCLDYNASDKTCSVVDNNDPHNEHYKFDGCQEWYHVIEEGSYKCMQDCSADLNGVTVTARHGQTRDFYKSSEETCTDKCEWATFTCNDWKWIQSWTNQQRDKNSSEYQYSSCTQKDKTCDREVYNVSQAEYDQWSWTSLYAEKCDEWTGSDRNTCTFTLWVYRLTGCKPGYHTENGKWCIPNYGILECSTIVSKPNHAHWSRNAGNVDYMWSNIFGLQYVDKWRFLKQWTWDWWGVNINTWEYPIPEDACKWDCNTWYRRNGNSCEKIDTTCKYLNDNQSTCTDTAPYACQEHAITGNTQDNGNSWTWECRNGLTEDTKQCIMCKVGYYLKDGECLPIVDGQCNNNEKYGCFSWQTGHRSSVDDSKWTWDCLGTPTTGRDDLDSDIIVAWPNCTAATDHLGCYKCKPGYTWDDCHEITATLTYYGNWHSEYILGTEILTYTRASIARQLPLSVPWYKCDYWMKPIVWKDGRIMSYHSVSAFANLKLANTIPEDLDLYAHWVENKATLTYKVTNNWTNNCGEEKTWDEEMLYSQETIADDYDSPSCYSFDYWSWANIDTYYAGQTIKDAEVEPEGKTLTAKCTKINYTLTYDPNGWEWSDWHTSTKTVNVCGDITLEDAPTREYHNFGWWYTEPEGGNKIGNPWDTIEVTDNITLYAHWTAIAYECGLSLYECEDDVEATNKDDPYDATKWTWNCGTKDCYKCRDWFDDQGWGICVNGCNHCASSGFPYCFPIDFRSTCNESSRY